MLTNRRSLFGAGLALTVASGAAPVLAAARETPRRSAPEGLSGRHFRPIDGQRDQTAALQAAIDAAASAREPLHLPAGVLQTGTLTLHSGTVLAGAAGLTTLAFTGGAGLLHAKGADHVAISDLVLDGRLMPVGESEEDGLLRFEDCAAVEICNVTVRSSLANGLVLDRCAGRIAGVTVGDVLLAGIRSIDADGLEISGCRISGCGNNGIQIWRRDAGEDGTIVTGNRIESIAAKGGGTGENGNGVNVFRAAGVLVSGNRIKDCAYSAVRGNAASNIVVTGNSCQRLGEVAIYAEFGFEGAVIANNLIDGAATGISVTNFDQGGRLAVVEGNVIRNLTRRDWEPVDVRGDGITVEADTIVSGNAVEGAPSAGIRIGWGAYLRNCVVSGNMLRDTGAGIAISDDAGAGTCLVTGNVIAGARAGAVRAMDHGTLVGPDLALAPSPAPGRLQITGNLVS